MRRHNKRFWLGLALFDAGFLLPSIPMTGRDFSGWCCAEFALTQRWESPGSLLRQRNFFECAILISPIFVITMALVLSNRYAQLFRILRIAFLSMTPFCWIVFAYVKAFPREGYAVWLSGIVLALLSARLGGEQNAGAVVHS